MELGKYVEEVKDVVLEVTKIDEADLLGHSLYREFCNARYIFMYILNEKLNIPHYECAKYCNRSHRQTSETACENIKNIINQPYGKAQKLELLKKCLEGCEFIFIRYEADFIAEHTPKIFDFKGTGNCVGYAKKLISFHCDLPIINILQCGRYDKNVFARQLIIYVLRELGFTWRDCAVSVGLTNHSTAMYSYNSITDIIKYPQFNVQKAQIIDAVLADLDNYKGSVK